MDVSGFPMPNLTHNQFLTGKSALPRRPISTSGADFSSCHLGEEGRNIGNHGERPPERMVNSYKLHSNGSIGSNGNSPTNPSFEPNTATSLRAIDSFISIEQGANSCSNESPKNHSSKLDCSFSNHLEEHLTPNSSQKWCEEESEVAPNTNARNKSEPEICASPKDTGPLDPEKESTRAPKTLEAFQQSLSANKLELNEMISSVNLKSSIEIVDPLLSSTE
jgi:hypothetical protein